jgi:phosphopantetheine adenylyltransferase
MNSNKIASREDFMNFFRNDEKINLLTPDDRVEIFSQILLGSSDITKKILEDLIVDYNVENLLITEVE